ncbi:hypothetical protein AVEN_208527-1 [Araneus ventricosus]|uniref:Uncharacterized protein n=1 Tax=Araneus ventricosus TaxID=182803 RepID=A0A4Y2E445_ARAVE|nr:hypothetical protein AVEN_208527-1 [Araneus ventricosus]
MLTICFLTLVLTGTALSQDTYNRRNDRRKIERDPSGLPKEGAGGTLRVVIRAGRGFIEEVLGVCVVLMPVLCPGARPGSQHPCIHHCGQKIVHGR